jgi:hypothetical protein
MRYETVEYVPRKPGFSIRDLRNQLPPEILAELVQDERLVYITVESHKTDVIRYIDSHFNIGPGGDLMKTTSLEIDQDEIDQFDYFFIGPKSLEGGRFVFCTETQPTCTSEACPYGAELIGPIRIKPDKARKIDMALVHRLWVVNEELLVSTWVKKLFETEGITGLSDYEQCKAYTEGIVDTDETVPVYMAKVLHSTVEHAKETTIIKSFICRKHNMPSSFYIGDRFCFHNELIDSDFQYIDRFVVNGQTYWNRSSHLVVSQKALKLLLKHKVRGLTPITYFLKQKFRPVKVI